MRVILTGATGYVGEGVLLRMLDDERIDHVLSVGRRSCGVSHPKLEEYIVPDMLTLQAGDARLAGYDVVFFIAGISSVGADNEVYKTICHDIPVHFAEIMPHKEQMSFIYLSGGGTTDKGKQYWQKVKSSTEKEIAQMGFSHSYGWRPMFMVPYQAQSNRQLKAQKAALLLYPIARLCGIYCTMTEMVDAMYNACTNGFHRMNVEAGDIIRLSRQVAPK